MISSWEQDVELSAVSVYLCAELGLTPLNIREPRAIYLNSLNGLWGEAVNGSPHPELDVCGGAGRAAPKGAGLSPAIIQVDRQVWPVSHFRPIKFSGVKIILCVRTHMPTRTHCVFLRIHACESVFYKRVCTNATHGMWCILTTTCMVLYPYAHILWCSWAVV